METHKRTLTGDGIVGWLWLVIGLLAVAMAREGAVTEPPTEIGAAEGLTARPIDLKTATVRELRGLPGIGNRRAVQISRARWEHDPETGVLELDDLPGIGPITRARVEKALVRKDPPSRGSGSPLELVGRPARRILRLAPADRNPPPLLHTESVRP